LVQLSDLYRKRFANTGLEKRQAVWRTLCDAYFGKLIPPDAAVLDVACGYGEFINNIRAREKYAIDLNPDAGGRLDPSVRFTRTPATDLSPLAAESVDVAFSSNFLEHLRSKDEVDTVFAEVRRVLRPGGRFILLGPNIKYAYKDYWDFYDHHLPLSHLSVGEGLTAAGYRLEKVIPQFLPFTMNNGAPTADILIRAYLAFPPAWRLLGAQFLVVAAK
jgi:SAM-dependent methyltransferase